MLTSIRKSRLTKVFSGFMTLTFITVNLAPLNVFALTSGPAQPETQQFAPAGMDNMVDPFTGDFSYNIPLMDVGGYPINLNYAAGITPDQEASWVGLGWNLNVGAINRSVRGLPDDFAGDEVETRHHIRPNQTFGLTYQLPFKKKELFTFPLGKIKVGASGAQTFNIFYNTYNGFGFSYGLAPSLDIPKTTISKKYDLGIKVVPGLSLSLGSEDGVGITPSVGLRATRDKNNNSQTLNTSIGFPFSTKEGAKGYSLSAGFSAVNNAKAVYAEDKAGNITDSRSGGSDVGVSGRAFHGFAMQTYTPNMDHDNYSVNATLNFTLEDIKNPAQDRAVFTLGGYYNGQFQESENERNPAYGYMYEGVSGDEKAVMDFNREKDGGYNETTTNMPITNHTYDIFSVSGQGVSGTYRLFRDDIATVGDPVNRESNKVIDVGLSGGFKPADDVTFKDLKLGVDFNAVFSNSSAGRWTSGRMQNLDNPNQGKSNTILEKAYFGKIGDMSPENDPTYRNGSLLADNAYAYSLIEGELSGQYDFLTQKGAGNMNRTFSSYRRQQRRTRNSSFQHLNAEKATVFATSPILSYKFNDFTIDQKSTVPTTSAATSRVSSKDQPLTYKEHSPVDRVGGVRKAHHISEVKVTDNSGARYVYGIPSYNNEQRELVFSVSPGGQRSTGLVSYDKTKDPTANNKNGIDHFYEETKTPGSASSYLLTYILSSDYVDSDGVTGPSDGDLGNYTKFNYSKTSSAYQWRTPFEKDKATYSEGLFGTQDDDKGSFTYGTKEIWYVHSIETKTHIAEFYLDERLDGLGVQDIHGGLYDNILLANNSSENRLKCLKKIVLYAKKDKLNGKNEPLKTVFLDYDYSLCPSTPNAVTTDLAGNVKNPTRGKLTLKKVWFTYGFSNKGVLNPYKFDYATDANFPYQLKNYDRWGNFKKESDNTYGNEVFPYTDQDKTKSDLYAKAYNLVRIKTPTGGEINVHYESDDYAYVQNKQAMRMFKIAGVSKDKGDSPGNTLYTFDLNEYKCLHIDLGEGFSATDEAEAKQYFLDKYIGDISELYYKVKLNVVAPKGMQDYIQGYCTFSKNLADIGVVYDATKQKYTRAVIKLDSEGLNKGTSKNIHPFVKNGWLYARMHYNRDLNGSVNANQNGLLQIVGAVASSLNSILDLVFGFRTFMKGNLNSSVLTSSESFVKLYEHDKVKIGGGHRVKAVVMNDSWNQMVGDKEQTSNSKTSSYYGQVYDYTYQENGNTISAGVAAYEPIVGGEENPFRKLVKTVDRVPLAPDKEYYKELPMGESFFPAPSVGYRKVRTTPVRIENGSYQVNSLISNGTGYVEQEFYTAYEFPTIVQYTNLEHYQQKTNPILKVLKVQAQDYVSCSQGYMIVLNDMHGKEKSKKVMPDSRVGTKDSDAISFVEYKYKVKADGTLDNQVPLVDEKLNITQESGREIGVEIDVVNDNRYYDNLTRGGGADINGKLSLPPSFPIPPAFALIITALPDWDFESTTFTSVTTTKVVNKHGILVKTIAMDNGQTITTENLAWDKSTGDVLLTQVANEFHDPIWNFTYAGHWAYKEMGLAYQNEGLEFSSVTNTGYDGIKPYLIDGDEIFCNYTKLDGTEANDRCYYDGVKHLIIDKAGDEVPSANIKWAKIARSGARNVAMTPIASVSTLKDPRNDTKTKIIFDGTKSVLNAGATEFKNVWKPFCNCGEASNLKNPFVAGQRGQLRPWRSWTYLTERVQTITNNEVRIRNDGYFADYQNFWIESTGLLQPIDAATKAASKWQYVTEIENYNPVGMEIENKDALNRFSMAQFGYARNLPVATSNNSRYQETGFDGFEDYDYGDCNDDHFSWRLYEPQLSSQEAHTGKQSLKVAKKSSAKIVKIIQECDQ